MPAGGARAEHGGPQGGDTALRDAVTMDTCPHKFAPTTERPTRRESPHGHGGLESMTMYRYRLIIATHCNNVAHSLIKARG